MTKRSTGVQITGTTQNKVLTVESGSSLVVGTSVPDTPSTGYIALYFNGTNILAKDDAGQTVTLTNRTGNPQTWA
jgi:predicted chitinase